MNIQGPSQEKSFGRETNIKPGTFGKKEVSQGSRELERAVQGRVAKSFHDISQIDNKNRGLGQRIWEAIFGIGEVTKKRFKEVKADLQQLKGFTEDFKDAAIDLNTIITKLDNNEYLNTSEIKELKKAILIENQKSLGIENAAEKTQVFYDFDTVLEERSESAMARFEKRLNDLGIAQNLEYELSFIKAKIEEGKEFTTKEVNNIRDAIMDEFKSQAQLSRLERENQELSDQVELLNIKNNQKDELLAQNSMRISVLESAQIKQQEDIKKNEQNISAKDEKIAELERKLQEVLDEAQKQKSLNGEINLQLTGASEKLRLMQKTNLELEKKLEIANNDLKVLHEVYDEQTELLAKTENEKSELNDKVETLELLGGNIENLKSTVQSQQKEAEKNAADLEEINKQREKMTEVVAEQENRLRELENNENEIAERVRNEAMMYVTLGLIAGATGAEKAKDMSFGFNDDEEEIEQLRSENQDLKKQLAVFKVEQEKAREVREDRAARETKFNK